MSENSSARTLVIDPAMAEIISGKRSVMPPGWMPVPCRVTPAALHTASNRARSESGGKNQPRGVTTLVPDSRIRATTPGSAMSGAYTAQSASMPSAASTSLVAATPIGSPPMSVPTSTPFFDTLCTQQPTSSRSGCANTPSTAARPTPPVAHCTTRNAIRRCLVRRWWTMRRSGLVDGCHLLIRPVLVGEASRSEGHAHRARAGRRAPICQRRRVPPATATHLSNPQPPRPGPTSAGAVGTDHLVRESSRHRLVVRVGARRRLTASVGASQRDKDRDKDR
jgi:hypothetical protein